MMTPQQIDLEQHIGRREISTLRVQVIILSVLLIAALTLCIVLITGMNTRFPMKKYIYTANAAAVCKFTPLDQRGDVTDAAVLNFAVLTAADMHTFDYINWRKTLDAVTISHFTPEARQAATDGLRRSGILTSVVDNSFVLKAVLSGPSTVISSGVVGGHFTWVVEVPMILAYTGGRNVDASTNYRPENRTITLTIRRAEFTADNPDGLLVSSMSSTQTLAQPGSPVEATPEPAPTNIQPAAPLSAPVENEVN